MRDRWREVLVLLVAAGSAGTTAAQVADPAQQTTSRATIPASSLVISGSPDGDEIVLFAQDLRLTLVEEGLILHADRALLIGDRELLALLNPPKSKQPADPLRFGPEIPAAPDRTPFPRLRRDDPASVAFSGLREIYAEGHVLFRQRQLGLVGGQAHEEVLFADRLYQHLLERRGVIVDADAYATTAYQGSVVDVHLRAGKLRALGRDKFAAESSRFSTCTYGNPHWHVQSDAMSVEMLPGIADPAQPAEPPDPADPASAAIGDRGEYEASLASTSGAGGARIGLAGNWLELFDVPVLPLPSFTANTGAGDALPLRKVSAGTSKKYGPNLQTLWGASLPEEAAAIEREFGTFDRPLELAWEADFDYFSKRGVGLGPALEWFAPGLIEGEIGGYWLKDREDEDFSQPFTIEHENRGRAYLRNRYTPAEFWRLDTEVQYYSDEGFQPEFFEKEFKEEKDPESYAHLVRQEDTTRLRFLYRNKLNDYQSQVDNLPRGSFDQLGEPIWKMPLSFLEQDGKPGYLVLSHAEDVGNFRLHPAEDSTDPSERVVRANSQLELATTVPLGPIGLRPFAAGSLTGWDRSASSNDEIGRFAGSAGARAEIVFHRNYDAWVPWLDVDGLRHVALFDADYVNVYEVSRDPDEIVQIDDVDQLDEREVYLLAVRQRLQTHRGLGIVDVFEFDLELPLYPHATRDNQGPQAGSTAGSTAGPLRYDLVHRPGFANEFLNNAVLYTEGEWNLHDSAMDVFNIGVQFESAPEIYDDPGDPALWSTLVSWRATRGISHVLTGELDFRLSEKWSVALLEQYDFDSDKGLEHRYELRRHGHDFTAVFSFDHSRSDGNTSFTIAIYPSFFRLGSAERSMASGRGARPELDQQQY